MIFLSISENIASLYSIKYTLFSIGTYGVSVIEFFGTLFGIVAVWLAAKNRILTWPVGLVNIVLFFCIYYQVGLFSDMFLQIYFFGVGVYGWIFWKSENEKKTPIRQLDKHQILKLTLWIFGLSLLCYYFVSNLHEWWPDVFRQEAAFPFWDSLVAVASIFANTLLARRTIDNWPIWILVDLICIILYISKGIYFIAFEFVIFTLLASYGWYQWSLEKKLYNKIEMQ